MHCQAKKRHILYIAKKTATYLVYLNYTLTESANTKRAETPLPENPSEQKNSSKRNNLKETNSKNTLRLHVCRR